MANRPLPTGGETREGHKKVVYFDHDGPNPYVVGGETLSAADVKALGLAALDFLEVSGASNDGTYFAAVRFSLKGSQPTARILWYLASTGAEAGAIDLSASFIRMRAVGPN